MIKGRASVSQVDLDHSHPSQLAEALSIDAALPDSWRPDELAAILRHQLQTALSVDLDVADGEPVSREAGTTFGELLLSPSPSLPCLQRVKRFVKACKSHPNSPLPKEIATALYFACIVAAEMRCGARITALEDAALISGLDWAIAQDWLDETLRNLLRDGLRRLRKTED